MDPLTALGVAGTLVTIGAAAFAWWTWEQSRSERRQAEVEIAHLQDVIRAVMVLAETRLPRYGGQVADAQGTLEAVHILCNQTLSPIPASSLPASDFPRNLDEAGVLLGAQLLDIEGADSLREVWVVTPDFEPDLTVAETTQVVARNIQSGVRYVFVVPDSMPRLAQRTRRLYSVLGLEPDQTSAQVMVITVGADHESIFETGNRVYYFREGSESHSPEVYHEVFFKKYPGRGLFWERVSLGLHEIEDISSLIREHDPD